jgi:hypothetical protein
LERRFFLQHSSNLEEEVLVGVIENCNFYNQFYEIVMHMYVSFSFWRVKKIKIKIKNLNQYWLSHA